MTIFIIRKIFRFSLIDGNVYSSLIFILNRNSSLTSFVLDVNVGLLLCKNESAINTPLIHSKSKVTKNLEKENLAAVMFTTVRENQFMGSKLSL